MKYGFLIALVAILFACDSDIDLIFEGDPIPVVYCLLDPGEDLQTIRLSKSYLSDQVQSHADSPDLIYYQTKVSLAVERMENNKVVDHTEFLPVTIEKDSGNFPGTEHVVYQATMSVAYSTTYRLVIFIEEINRLVYAYTTTQGKFSVVDPAYPEVRSIHLVTDHNPVFHWTQADNASIYQLCFQLNYYESDSLSTRLKSAVIPLKTLIKRESPGRFYVFDINSNQFYIALGALLDPDEHVLRSFESLDAFVIAGGEELAVHYETEEEGDPFRIIDYTNLQNGLGFFSSIGYAYSRGFKITGQTVDSLAYGQYTKQLNFLDRDGNRKDQ